MLGKEVDQKGQRIVTTRLKKKSNVSILQLMRNSGFKLVTGSRKERRKQRGRKKNLRRRTKEIRNYKKLRMRD